MLYKFNKDWEKYVGSDAYDTQPENIKCLKQAEQHISCKVIYNFFKCALFEYSFWIPATGAQDMPLCMQGMHCNPLSYVSGPHFVSLKAEFLQEISLKKKTSIFVS